ncbi:hypothetical protein [Aliivibrio sifiae]|uniref:3-phosphoshikimate 1-carboxyvinyltransferase n=1 Tax=Aliivibrio sifiae TaxID=566293 RepID=A0A2S7XA66_9GAMM|nr:hypothetical protein [Aliivibrio sifiae]PQJ88250.1 hypothetical protein BTO22_01015 [Aliivibrio sifiae]
MMNKKQQRLIAQFYASLDETTASELTSEQRKSIERAIIATGLGSNNKVDIRKSISIFNKRYFFVFLLGRDFRQQLRNESPFAVFMMTLLMALGVLSLFALAVVTLYLIKSALGIDIFHNFSFGIWDWFKELMNIT